MGKRDTIMRGACEMAVMDVADGVGTAKGTYGMAVACCLTS